MNKNDLSFEKKLAALTSRRIWEEEGADDAKAIAEMRDIAMEEDDLIVPFESIADSWNVDLAKKITGLVAEKARTKGAGSIILPPLSPKTRLSSKGVSEDVFHMCELASSECEGALAVGVRPIIGRFGIEKDMLTGDAVYDRKAIAETFVKPLFAMKKDGRLPAVIYDEYDDVNFGLSDLVNTSVAKPEYEFCERTQTNDTVKQIACGRRIIYGDTLFAADAYADWKYYQKQLVKSAISEAKIRYIARKGSIIGEETISTAYDLAEAFDEKCRRTTATGSFVADEERILAQLAEESVVLLKNGKAVSSDNGKTDKRGADNLLPLSKGVTVAVVGNCTAEDFISELASAKINNKVFAGYDMKSEEGMPLTDEQKQSIKACDVILYFIDNARKKGRISELPPNRLAVLSELSSLGKPIVAIAIGKAPLDMSFDEKCNGVFVARGNCAYLGRALTQLIFGDKNPSGRLSVSYYERTDEYFREMKRDAMLAKTKKGTFFGYRYYDGSGARIKYPFGYGLSYSSCEYTLVRADKTGVVLRLKNTGNRPVSETVQVYAGMKNPVSPKAKKELIGFTKVRLAVGETKTLSVGFYGNTFAGYSTKNDCFTVEKGSYILYVGASCFNIRLSASLEVDGKPQVPSKRSVTEFLPWKTNIVSGGYTIEEGENLMKNSKKISVISWIMLIAALMYDLVALVLWAKNNFYFGLYDIGSLVTVSLFIVCNLIVIISLVILSNVRKRNKDVEQLLVKLKEDKFADATVVRSDEAGEVFKKVEAGYETESYEEQPEDAFTRNLSYDKDKKMSQVCFDLKKYLAERGFDVQMDEVRAIVSAFASSKLIITGGSDMRKAAIITAGEFFGKLFAASVIGDDENSIFKNTYVKAAIEHARTSRDEMVFCILQDMSADICRGCFTKLMAYFASSESGKRIFYDNNGKEEAIFIPANLWVMVILEDDVALSEMSEVVGRSAVLLSEVNACDRVSEFSPMEKLGFNQLVMMTDVAEDNSMVDEEEWKIVDKLGNELKPYGFELDNKNWQMLEKFAAVFIAADGDEKTMMDHLVSVLLLPCVLKYNPLLIGDGKSLKGVRNDLFSDSDCEKSEVVLKELLKHEKSASVEPAATAAPAAETDSGTISGAESEIVTDTESDSGTDGAY